MLIAEVFNIKLKENATAGATTSGVMASIAMPMFTGKRGGDHYATARRAVDPMGKIFKKKNLRKAPHKLKDSADKLVYSKEVTK
tara:strand:- start:1577 stop:1828 length:252 start_codon:yes stop_codon:yes gene_type:complete